MANEPLADEPATVEESVGALSGRLSDDELIGRLGMISKVEKATGNEWEPCLQKYYDMKNENCPELPECEIWNKK